AIEEVGVERVEADRNAAVVRNHPLRREGRAGRVGTTRLDARGRRIAVDREREGRWRAGEGGGWAAIRAQCEDAGKGEARDKSTDGKQQRPGVRRPCHRGPPED